MIQNVEANRWGWVTLKASADHRSRSHQVMNTTIDLSRGFSLIFPDLPLFSTYFPHESRTFHGHRPDISCVWRILSDVRSQVGAAVLRFWKVRRTWYVVMTLGLGSCRRGWWWELLGILLDFFFYGRIMGFLIIENWDSRFGGLNWFKHQKWMVFYGFLVGDIMEILVMGRILLGNPWSKCRFLKRWEDHRFEMAGIFHIATLLEGMMRI